MKLPLILSALALILSPLSHASDWIDLFNGKNTEGWNPRAEVETFEVVDGEIHLLATKNVWVTSDRQMADFEASVEVLLPENAEADGLNTGFAFRLMGEEGKPKGYQVEIEGAHPGENGAVFAIGLGGWLYPKDDQKEEFLKKIDGVIKQGDWNTYRVICDGPDITTFVNDIKITEVTNDQSLRGYFGIQHHGKGGTIRFRNLKARELPSPSPETSAADLPNILWLTAEDMSPTLGCYGDEYATTPNLDQFAKEAVRYTNAFAAAPVCSPSRSTLITGIWAPSSGTHQMRSAFMLPDEVHGFPTYLREAGYFTTNNVKTDYNTGSIGRLIEESWNENSDTATWQSNKRKDGQPFFAVFNHMTSHQSRTAVWPHEAFEKHVQSALSEDQFHDPDTAPVPPYYPDIPSVRKTVARFYDCVTVMDQQIGARLQELEDEGLTDNTIVFFYSDHGSGMPRHKRLLTDSGMHVPLMIRFPEKWQHLAPAKPGETVDRLVTFVDYPATLLSMLGLEVPDYMEGEIFLGPDTTEAPAYAYGFRDRVDEVFDTARSVRSDRYLYIRNYMPHHSWNPPSVFSDLAEVRREITRHAGENSETLTEAQRHYTNATRAPEEFYDVVADPQNINNLLTGELNGEQTEALKNLRAELARKRMEIFDNGALPEAVMANYIAEENAPIHSINRGATNHRPNLETAWAAADLVGTGTREQLLELVQSGNASQRYWGIIGLRYASPDDEELLEQLYDYMDDYSAPVRLEMAFWMAEASEKHRETALAVLVRELYNENWWTALRACRAIELLGENARSVLPAMQKRYDETRHEAGDNNFFIAFSSGAFLDKMGGKTDPWDFTPSAGSFSADPEEDEE